MFTLVYVKNQFNRPDTLSSFLHANVGKLTLLQIDCISPYHGTEDDLIIEVCKYLSSVDPELKVFYNATKNSSVEIKKNEILVNYLVVQIFVSCRD